MRRIPHPRQAPIAGIALLPALALVLALALAVDVDASGPALQDAGPLDPAVVAAGLELAPSYRWRAGDQLAWAAPGFDDSAWREQAVGDFPVDDWTGLGWLRFRVRVDPALHGRPVGLRLLQTGATEIYVDGRLTHRFGRVGHDRASERADRTQDPRPVVFEPPGEPRPGGGAVEHVVAVRYSSHLLESPRWAGEEPGAVPRLGPLRPMAEGRLELVRKLTAHQMVLSGVTFAFTLTHLMLFLFRRRVGPNLFFVLLAAATGLSLFSNFQAFVATDPAAHLNLVALFHVGFLGMALTSLRFVYSLLEPRLPRTFWPFFAVALPLGAWSVFQPVLLTPWVYVFMLVVNVELVRAMITNVVQRREPVIQGGGIVGVGALPLALLAPYQLLASLDLVPDLWRFVDFPAPYYGLVILMASMSIYLARDFARTQVRLERELGRVRRLSREALEQERRAREQEVERARLEAENRRKDAELEEARRLQLSLLPRQLPSPTGLDVAAHMRTATEVGGDYYDFLPAPGGGLVAVLGDATGHGVQAGTLVAATQGVLQGLEPGLAPGGLLDRVSAALRRLGPRRRHMALVAARFADGGRRVVLASAGMPPVLVYRAADATVEEIEFQSLPLGSRLGDGYEQKALDLAPGDRLVLMTDGLPETVDGDGEPLGYPRVAGLVAREGPRPAPELLDALLAAAGAWSRGEAPRDDLTLLVVGVEDA